MFSFDVQPCRKRPSAMRQVVHEKIVLYADSAFLETKLHARRKNRHAHPHLPVIFCPVIKPVCVESFLSG